MKAIDIAKYTFVVYTISTHPLIGIGFLGYIIYTDSRLKNIKEQTRIKILEKDNEVALKLIEKDKELESMSNQLKNALLEIDDDKILTDNLADLTICGDTTETKLYDGCVIEGYQDKFWRIIAPNGQYVSKIFLSIEDAEEEIRLVKPFLK